MTHYPARGGDRTLPARAEGSGNPAERPPPGDLLRVVAVRGRRVIRLRRAIITGRRLVVVLRRIIIRRRGIIRLLGGDCCTGDHTAEDAQPDGCAYARASGMSWCWRCRQRQCRQCSRHYDASANLRYSGDTRHRNSPLISADPPAIGLVACLPQIGGGPEIAISEKPRRNSVMYPIRSG